jgi:hypothetical protein
LAGLRLVSPEQTTAAAADEATALRAADDAAAQNTALNSSLVAFIDNQFSYFIRHRDGASGWSDRLVEAMRTFNGQYDTRKLAEIRRFGGSEIYARLIATKCRGATSLLRDIYLNADKPWGLKPTPDPTLPDDIGAEIGQLVQAEVGNAQRGGMPPDPNAIKDRVTSLIAAAKRAALVKARKEAEVAFRKLDDFLVEGGMYKALEEALIDIPLFPFCCIKGPVVKIEPRVTWVNGKAQTVNKPLMRWYRVSLSTSGGRPVSRTSPTPR